VVDPKIAAWMLHPDHPPVTFQQTLDQWMDLGGKSAEQVRDGHYSCVCVVSGN